MKRCRLWIGLCLTLVAASCGESKPETTGESRGAPATLSVTAPSTTGKPPIVGGTLTFGEFGQPNGLDPIVAAGGGTTGGIELAAIYDTLLRYSPSDDRYDMITAESLTPNADSTEWVLKIKPNISFSDGTAYDAAAVAFGINRHRSGLQGAPACAEYFACPRNASTTAGFVVPIKEVVATDALTVKLTLSQPWAGLPFALASEVGMIPSPTALKKCDASKPANACEFNLKPVGAGPFVVDSFKPREAINLVRNTSYWGGQVYLDGIRFVDLGDTGGPNTFDAFKTGTLQAAFLSSPAAVSQSNNEKIPGYSFFSQAGTVFLLNTGVAGSTPATRDVKVRQAIAAALDLAGINQRAYDNRAIVGSTLFHTDFPWYPGVVGPSFDLSKAKQLVAEARSAGWDGKVRFATVNSPIPQAIGVAVEAMLKAAGMEPIIESRDTGAHVGAIAVDRNFDVAIWIIGVSNDEAAFVPLAQHLESTSGGNLVGYKSAAVDAAIESIRKATTNDQKKAAYRTIASEVAKDVPILPFVKQEYRTIWKDNVKGIVPTSRATVMLGKAWIDK